MNFETLQRLKRIEQAISSLQAALDSLQAQVTEMKPEPSGLDKMLRVMQENANARAEGQVKPKRETLTLRKRSG